MQLLCLSDATTGSVLPGLELLPHVLHTSPVSVRLSTSAAERFDLLLIDATSDLRLARTACLELAANSSTPRLLICQEAGLAAVSVEWAVADVLLPDASPAEIDLRLRLAVGRLADSAATPASKQGAIRASGVEINDETFTARVQDRTLDLTYKEFELLHFLAQHPGRVFTREQLLGEVWGSDYYGGTRTVDVHVRRLRAKLAEHESLIGTVRGVGYGFARHSEGADATESI